MMNRVEFEQALAVEAMGMFTLIIGFGPDDDGIDPDTAAEMAVEKYKAAAKLSTNIAHFAADEFQKRIDEQPFENGECPSWTGGGCH